MRRATRFRKTSPHFGPGWQPMVGLVNLAPSVARRFSGLFTRKTKPTTAHDVRPEANCSPIGRYRGCSRTTGRRRLKNSKRLEAPKVARFDPRMGGWEEVPTKASPLLPHQPA